MGFSVTLCSVFTRSVKDDDTLSCRHASDPCACVIQNIKDKAFNQCTVNAGPESQIVDRY